MLARPMIYSLSPWSSFSIARLQLPYPFAVPESIGLRRFPSLAQWLKWEQHQRRYGIIRMGYCFDAT